MDSVDLSLIKGGKIAVIYELNERVYFLNIFMYRWPFFGQKLCIKFPPFYIHQGSIIHMAKQAAGAEIEKLIQLMARVPGLGPRSARRAVLQLVKKKDALLAPLGQAMRDVQERVQTCPNCGNVDTRSPCMICSDPARSDATLIVVEDVADLWALERAGAAQMRYHVLGGRLSPLEGVGPDDLNIDSLIDRVARGGVKEVILAVNATVEGQTTAHYIADRLADFSVKITKLAHGIPIGGELDYLDEGTLELALRSRS